MSKKLRELNRRRKNPELYSFEVLQSKLEKDREESTKKLFDSSVIGAHAKQLVAEEVSVFKTKLEGEVAQMLDKVANIEDVSEKRTDKFVKDTVKRTEVQFNEIILGVQQEVSGVGAILSSIKDQILNLMINTESKISEFFSDAERFKGEKGDSIKGDPGDPGKKGEMIPLEEILEALQPTIRGMRQDLSRAVKSQSGGGGGMGAPVSFSFTGDGLSSFTLSTKVAANGMACWAYLNGQWLQPGVHFNISGKTMTTTFNLETNDTLEGFYLRT